MEVDGEFDEEEEEEEERLEEADIVMDENEVDSPLPKMSQMMDQSKN